jgi:uncharacterized membrane protein YvlD (DUF360 family)
VTLSRVVITGAALWLAAQVIAGIRLATGLDPLATIGTVLVVALMLGAVRVATRGIRRVIVGVVGARPIPVALMAVAALNAAVFWLATAVAGAIGLGYTVDGPVAALLGSLVLTVVLALAGHRSLDRAR